MAVTVAGGGIKACFADRWSQSLILNLVSIVSVEFSLQCLKGVSVCES